MKNNITSNICAAVSIVATFGSIGCLLIGKPSAFMILFLGSITTFSIAILTEKQ